MNVITERIHIETVADGGMHDLTERVQERLTKARLKDGITTLFCVGSTSSVSTVEYEPGLCKDVPACLDRIAPAHIDYAHRQTWHDDNGRSHVKSTLMGPSLTVPFIDGELTLGRWQQIVLLEWDTRPRSREVILQFMGM